jgi:hypothetical protein
MSIVKGNMDFNFSSKKNPSFLVELSGTPNGGKDTQAYLLSEYYRNEKKIKVKIFDEAYTSSKNKFADLSYVERFKSTIPIVCSNLIKPLAGYNLGIQNRGLFDLLGYLRFYLHKNEISAEDEKAFSHFILDPLWRSSVSSVFLILISPTTSLIRENLQQEADLNYLAKKRKIRKTHKNYIMTLDTLKTINISFQEVYEEYKDYFPCIHKLDMIEDFSRRELADRIETMIAQDLKTFQSISGVAKTSNFVSEEEAVDKTPPYAKQLSLLSDFQQQKKKKTS